MEQKNYDVFISYSSKDQKVAEGICGYLESRKYRCFVAYRDIPKGKVWAAVIPSSIHASKMMIVVFSESFNMSTQTDRELELAAEDRLPILTFRINDILFTGAKEFYLKNLNWIDAFPEPEKCFGQIYESVSMLVPKSKKFNSVKEDIKGDIIEKADIPHDLKIKVEVGCFFYIDGEEKGKLIPGKIEKFSLCRGEYELKFVSTNNPTDVLEIDFEMPNFGKFMRVQQKDICDNSLRAKNEDLIVEAEQTKDKLKLSIIGSKIEDETQSKKKENLSELSFKENDEAIRMKRDEGEINELARCPVCGSTDIGLWNSRKRTYHCHNCDLYFNKESRCPVCGSTDIGLWNSRKRTYHCHNCDHYFNELGLV